MIAFVEFVRHFKQLAKKLNSKNRPQLAFTNHPLKF